MLKGGIQAKLSPAAHAQGHEAWPSISPNQLGRAAALRGRPTREVLSFRQGSSQGRHGFLRASPSFLVEELSV